MDEIVVSSADMILKRYVFHPSMVHDKTKDFLVGHFLDLDLPYVVKELYRVWSSESNYDGDNGTLTYRFGVRTYQFINHYWD